MSDKNSFCGIDYDLVCAVLRHTFSSSPPWTEMAAAGALPANLSAKSASNRWGQLKKTHGLVVGGGDSSSGTPKKERKKGGEIGKSPGKSPVKSPVKNKANAKKRKREIDSEEDEDEEEERKGKNLFKIAEEDEDNE